MAFSFVMTFLLAVPSWAGQTCVNSLRSTPVARISFNSQDTQKKKSNTITLTKKNIALNPTFTQKFLTGLTSFVERQSTTISRVEERAIISETDSKKLLDESWLNWTLRDKKDDNEDFTTITTYLGKFILGSTSDTAVTAKLRARKYFSHRPGETDSTKMTSVFGSISSVELKITNVSAITAFGYETLKGSIFKPKVFIADSTLKNLSKISIEKLSNPEIKNNFIDEISNLQRDGSIPEADSLTQTNSQAINTDRSQVVAFVHALVLLLEKNPNLFDVQMVTAYNRESHKSITKTNTEYQYTLDRNIRIFEPSNDFSASNIQGYLDTKPLHKVDNDVIFAELKSPPSEKTKNTAEYQRLSRALFSKHQEAYNADKGKYGLGAKIRKTITQTNLSEQLYSEGLYYYLVKGVGNLPQAPNRKKLVEMGEIDIALPLKINNENHRLIVSYEQNNVEGDTYEVLSSLSMVDSLGQKVPLDSSDIKNIVKQAHIKGGNVTININRQALTFPSAVDPATVVKFNNFFDEFYTNHSKGQANPREINSLHTVTNQQSLAKYTRKMKMSNKLRFLADRTSKVIAGAVIIGAITLGPEICDRLFGEDAPSKSYQELSINLGDETLRLKTIIKDGSSLQVLSAETDSKDTPDIEVTLDEIQSVDTQKIILKPQAQLSGPQ